MENAQAKQIISEAKNITLISPTEPEAASCALALFYTLKESGKNVNLICESLPQNIKFLAPSLDFISYPKNFVLSIPEQAAKISQIYYEKSNEALKIHLTVENGQIKKEDVAFYFSEPKPDLIITLGVRDYQKQLEQKLDSFGFLLDSPILDIDNNVQDNKKFGKINIIENKSLAEIVSELAQDIKETPALCLLASLVAYTKNFKENLTAPVFELAASLMKKGADLKKVSENFKI